MAARIGNVLEGLNALFAMRPQLAQAKSVLQALLTQGAKVMADFSELEQNLQDISDLNDQILAQLANNDARVAALNAEIAVLVASANIKDSEKAALQTKIDAAIAKSQAIEDKARAAIPQVPPVGTPPLASSYATRADFDAGVAAYQGPEAITLDGTEVRAGTTPSVDFYGHSADGSITTSGPTD